MISARHVVITGVGLCSPLGGTFEDFALRLFAEDVPFERLPRGEGHALPVALVTERLDIGLTRSESRLLDRSVKMALLAATRALHGARLEARSDVLAKGAVYVGNGSGPTHALDESYANLHRDGRIAPLTLLRCLPCGSANFLSMRLGLRGPNHTITAACASSTMALGEAIRAIRHGYVNLALAGGTEAPFGEGTLRAWEGLRVLAPCASDIGCSCRPFDVKRRGLVLGEGAVFFVLEAAESAHQRGVRPLARLSGYAASSDAYHWTEPLGAGQRSAMRGALADAGLSPRDISAINAHGTGTPMGDRVETESIVAVFADAPKVLVSSTKSRHGHLLGASGAIELAAALVSLKKGAVPPTHGLEQPEPACRERWVRHAPASIERTGVILSNTFAFGGINACLVLSEE